MRARLCDIQTSTGSTCLRDTNLWRTDWKKKRHVAPICFWEFSFNSEFAGASERLKTFWSQICEALQADGLLYQSLEDLLQVGVELNPQVDRFDASCFDGHYVTGDVTEEYLERLESGGRGKGRESGVRNAKTSSNGSTLSAASSASSDLAGSTR